MLNLMRKNAGTWLIKILLGAIVLVFVFWGVGSFRDRGAGRVASVNGEPIMVEEYNETYNRLVEQMKQRYGNRLNDEMLKMLQVKKQTIDQLIEKRLLLTEAKRLNFHVSDEELTSTIKAIPAFQDNGNFDTRRYRAVLAQNRLTPESFEIKQREFILMDKVRALVSDCVKVSDAEIEDSYQWKNSQIKIDYALFDPSLINDIRLSEDEIKAYFGSHKDSYKTEPKRKAAYLQFTPEMYSAKVSLPDSEIKDYFESHPGEFDTPKTVQASHILIKVDPDANPELVEKAKEKALQVLKMAKGGKDFAELAKQYSDDPGGKNGGSLGTFKRNSMVEPFGEKAFSMNPGEISDPVRTQFGWHIIKVEKVNEAATLTFEQASSKIVKKLTDEKAKSIANEEAYAAYNAALNAESLSKVATTLKQQLITTEPFGRNGPTGVKNPAQFATTAFELSLNAISDIIDSGDAYYILQVIEDIPETIPEFTQVADKVRADLMKEKQDEQALKDARQCLSDLKSGKLLKEFAGKKSVKTGSTDFFKRSDRIPDIGFEREMSSTAFGLSSAKKYPDEPIKGQKGYYVIAFGERKAADPAGLASEKTQITDMLTSQKQRRTFEDLLASLRNRGKIVLENGYL
ncbi:MAG: SurA N-terminal domain-containing protein [Deltaproteobacteria bacterium]|nr:SurA N-terminal domain-containing protein [Deltaproteobacteria bacterium]